MNETPYREVTFTECVANSITLLPNGILKCCCCNFLLFNDNYEINTHLNSDMHIKKTQRFDDLDLSLTEEQCQKIFEYHIAISLAIRSSVEDDDDDENRKYVSFCYHCQNLILDGANGLTQHLSNGSHEKKRINEESDFCHICLIRVNNNLQDHLSSKFHKAVIEHNLKYGHVVDTEFLQLTRKLEKIPVTFLDLREYKTLWLNIITEEQSMKNKHAKSCGKKVLHVQWNNKIGKKKHRLIRFVPEETDDQFFEVRVGDELVINSTGTKKWGMAGHVIAISNMKRKTVYLMLKNVDGIPTTLDENFVIIPKINKTTNWIMRSTLSGLQQYFENNELEFVRDILLGTIDSGKVYKNKRISTNDIIFLQNQKLNDSQLEAIKMAMTEQVSIIQGPPGTGKTETCLYIVKNLIRQNPSIKILVCAHSSTAVDLLVKKLTDVCVPLVRIFSDRHELMNSSMKIFGWTEQTLHRNPTLEKYNNNFEEDYEDKLKEAKNKVLDSVPVACCTCMGAGVKGFQSQHYDVVLVDEASQATEPECLVPMVLHGVTKVILVGDHKQLGPSVMSPKAKEAGLGVSLFQRWSQDKGVRKTVLTGQYRMHPAIAKFPKEQFYKNKLENKVEAEDRTLSFDWMDESLKDKPVMFFNVNELEEPVGKSYRNVVEAECVMNILRRLIQQSSVKLEEVAVITPYEGQRRLFREMVVAEERNDYKDELARIKIANVDAFQGAEKDVVLLSLVRSNLSSRECKVFLTDEHLNVALTRARKKLILVGNILTLQRNSIFGELLQSLEKQGMPTIFYRSRTIRPLNVDLLRTLNSREVFIFSDQKLKKTKANFVIKKIRGTR